MKLFPDEKGETNSGHFPFFKKLKPTVVFETYWRFAAERQAVFFRRLRGQPRPWTDDRILREYKFTNAYRASDRVSQFLINQVIYEGDRDGAETVFRVLLFKLFNRIETWQLLEGALGEIRLRNFDIGRCNSVLSNAIESGDRIYSAAYIMPTGGRKSGFLRKHEMHLSLLQRMIEDDLPDSIERAESLEEVYNLLCSYDTIGPFLGYQYTTDLNYSEVLDFCEMDFVVAGPGAKSGLRKCFGSFGGLSEGEIIREVAEHQEACFSELGLEFDDLWGRKLKLIDCQNLFCEVDKYARIKHPEFVGVAKRTRIKQKFTPNPTPIRVRYPPKWGLNKLIEEENV